MKQTRSQFPLSSDECELLLFFESSPRLTEVGQIIGRDHSVVARAIKKIAERFPVVEKKNGRWILTEMGRAINEETRTSISKQASVLSSHPTLRIGTNREFATRVLCADFANFQKLFPEMELTINSFQQGAEDPILTGKVDIGLDCDRPLDPLIGYRLVAEEKIIAVASKYFLKKYNHKSAEFDYMLLPHLLCERLNPDRILSAKENRTQVIARFNDIASAREACVQSIGWALLPAYAVKKELKEGLLVKIVDENFGNFKYGVWWSRGRPHLKTYCERIASWLQKQEL